MITIIFSVGLLLLILVLSYYWIFANKKTKIHYSLQGSLLKEPPCLPRIPYFGSLPYIPSFSYLHTIVGIIPDKYDDVVGFYLMDKYFVLLNKKEAMRDAFVKRSLEFSDRPASLSTNKFLNPNNKGIFFHRYNDDFKKYHKVGVGIMKQFGFGSRVMETKILEEVKCLLKNLTKFKGEEFNPHLVFINYSMNVISVLLFDQRFEEDDPRLTQIIENINESLKVGDFLLVDQFPFFRYIPYFKRRIKKLIDVQAEIFSTLNQQMSFCMDINNNRASFIKSYIEEEGPDYDKEQLRHFVKDLFLAGSDTTASTLERSLVYLANNPSVQEKMWKELDKVALYDGMVSLDSKKDLPYCEAVMSELFRIKPAATLSVPRCVTKDTQILDYYIPTNTSVMANIYGIHHDPQVWGDPDIFRPERFLDQNGCIDESKRELLVTFSLGKRSCFGEILAKQELFLSLTNVVKRFIILPPLGKSQIEVTDIVDVTVRPSPFTARLVERHLD